MGSGVKNIVYTGSGDKPTFSAKGWDHPIFWYEGNDESFLYIQNINLKFDSFTDSAIRIYTAGTLSNSQLKAAKGPDDDGGSGVAAVIMLNSVDGYFNNFNGNSTIFIESAEGWDDLNCGDEFDDTCEKKSVFNIGNVDGPVHVCMCPNEQDPGRAPLLAIANSTIDFKNNTIGSESNPIYHAGAAIYVKNGGGAGNGAGITYKNVTLNFDGNKVYMSNNRGNPYENEGGGAVRTNNFVGGGNKNTLEFNNNSIKVIGGNDAVGGGAYVNDGWWCHQGEGDTTINAKNNTADKGTVGFMDQNGSGGTFFAGNCSGNVSSSNGVSTFDNSGSGDRHCGNVNGCDFPDGTN